jgi:hypothetical protein
MSSSQLRELTMKNELSNLDLAAVAAGAEKFNSKSQTNNTSSTNQTKGGKG